MTQDEKRKVFVTKAIADFQDGFEPKDLFTVVDSAVLYVADYKDFAGADKKSEVIKMLEELVAELDPPGPNFAWNWAIEHFVDPLIERSVAMMKEKLRK